MRRARIGKSALIKGVTKSFESVSKALDEASDDSVTESFRFARIRLLLVLSLAHPLTSSCVLRLERVGMELPQPNRDKGGGGSRDTRWEAILHHFNPGPRED